VTNEETGLKAVKYNSLVAPLIQAVKELYVMIKNNLKTAISKFESSNLTAIVVSVGICER
jgi:hypothetical protein